jgi:hypothetical protein
MIKRKHARIVKITLISILTLIVGSYMFYYFFIPKQLYFSLRNECVNSNFHLEVKVNHTIFSDSISYNSFTQPLIMVKDKGIVDFEIKVNNQNFSFTDKNSINLLTRRYITIFIYQDDSNENTYVNIHKSYSIPKLIY